MQDLKIPLPLPFDPRRAGGAPNINPRGDEGRVVRRQARRSAWLTWLAFAIGLLAGCERRPEEPVGTSHAAAGLAAVGGSGAAAPSAVASESWPAALASAGAGAAGDVAPDVRELLSLPRSAYQATLAADEDAFYVLTSDAAYRVQAGAAPAKRALDLGFGAAVMRASFVFWSGGAIVEAPKRGGALRRLLPWPERPQGFYASPDHFAWLERSENGAGRLRSLSGKKARDSYVGAAPIDAVALLNDWLFFVERVGGDSYRIGGVPAGGGTPAFTAARRGRSPSSLVGQRDLYFYDGKGFAVRKLSPDLAREETLSSGIVCSPIAVANERVFCGSVEGVFELREGKRHSLSPGKRRTPVAGIAANADYVAWLAEAGENQLVVKAVKLSR